MKGKYPNFLRDINNKFIKFKTENPLEYMELNVDSSMYMSNINQTDDDMYEIRLHIVPNNQYCVSEISPIKFKQHKEGDFCIIHIPTLGHSFTYVANAYTKLNQFIKTDCYGYYHSNESEAFKVAIKIIKKIFNIDYQQGMLYYND